jgi:hypothetical protein
LKQWIASCNGRVVIDANVSETERQEQTPTTVFVLRVPGVYYWTRQAFEAVGTLPSNYWTKF